MNIFTTNVNKNVNDSSSVAISLQGQTNEHINNTSLFSSDEIGKFHNITTFRSALKGLLGENSLQIAIQICEIFGDDESFEFAKNGDFGGPLKELAIKIYHEELNARRCQNRILQTDRFDRITMETWEGKKLSLSGILNLNLTDLKEGYMISESKRYKKLYLFNLLKNLDCNNKLGLDRTSLTSEQLRCFQLFVLNQALNTEYSARATLDALRINELRFTTSGIKCAIDQIQEVGEINSLEGKFKRIQVMFNLTLQNILNLTQSEIRWGRITSSDLKDDITLHSLLIQLVENANMKTCRVRADKLLAFKREVLEEAVKGSYGEQVQKEAIEIQKENERKAKLLSPEAQSNIDRPVLIDNFACDSMEEWIIGKFLLDYLKDSQERSFQITNETFQLKVNSPQNTSCRFDFVIPARFTVNNIPLVLEWHPFREDLEEKKIKGQLKKNNTTEYTIELEDLLQLANANKPKFKHVIQTTYTNYRSLLATNEFGDDVQVVCFQEGSKLDRQSLYYYLSTCTLFHKNGSIESFEQFESQWLDYSEEIKKIQDDKKIKRAAEQLKKLTVSQGIQLEHLASNNIDYLLNQKFNFYRKRISLSDIKTILVHRGVAFENDQEFLVYLQSFA